MTDYLVTDDNGNPLYFANMDQITSEGGGLAMALAAVAGDRAEIARISAETLDRLGVEMFGMVAANALNTMADYILGGAFDVAMAHGVDMRDAMRRIVRGESPEDIAGEQLS